MTTVPIPRIVAVDIGGANLKYVVQPGDGSRDTRSLARPFAMWNQSQKLGSTIAKDLGSLGLDPWEDADFLLVTMTGELADCFIDRPTGVRFIVDEVLRLNIPKVRFYGLEGDFLTGESAKQDPMTVASANWHATASWLAKEPDAIDSGTAALLIDIGSTTTDLIVLGDGRVQTSAKTDADRLAEGSLVYVGGLRTPVCALVDCLPFRDKVLGVMNEWFATIDDARILLGFESPDPTSRDTADGAPRTVVASATRVLRMVGHDLTSATIDEAIEMSRVIHQAASGRIDSAMRRLRSTDRVLLVGQADDLLPVTDQEVVRPSVPTRRCGPCHAMIQLWMGR